MSELRQRNSQTIAHPVMVASSQRPRTTGAGLHALRTLLSQLMEGSCDTPNPAPDAMLRSDAIDTTSGTYADLAEVDRSLEISYYSRAIQQPKRNAHVRLSDRSTTTCSGPPMTVSAVVASHSAILVSVSVRLFA